MMNRMQANSNSKFVLCIKNESFVPALEVRKIYQVIPDPQAAVYHYIRVIDELGTDYLCPASNFVPIELPTEAQEAFAALPVL